VEIDENGITLPVGDVFVLVLVCGYKQGDNEDKWKLAELASTLLLFSLFPLFIFFFDISTEYRVGWLSCPCALR
jgi:hypothetical protein